MKLEDQAPNFCTTAHNGESFCLNDFLGKNVVVLFFYPQDGTPVCTAEACSFRDAHQDFLEAGAVVIGVSGDDEESHQSFAATQRLPYYLVSDHDGKLRELYEVPKTFGIIPGRVTYVIDLQGKIQLIFNSQLQGQQHAIEALKKVRELIQA